MECDTSGASSEGESSDDLVSMSAASAELDHGANYDSMWAARAVSEARRHQTPPALDSDNDTLSDTSSSGNEDEDIIDAVSDTDEPFGTNNPAFPANLTDGEGFLRLNSTRLAMKDLATPDNRSSANTQSLGRFLSTEDDPWSVYASSSLLFNDTCNDLALDHLIASIKGLNTASDAGTH